MDILRVCAFMAWGLLFASSGASCSDDLNQALIVSAKNNEASAQEDAPSDDDDAQAKPVRGSAAPSTEEVSGTICDVTGFYSGAQIGPNFISNKFKKNAVAKDAVKRSKTGFVADAFGGYNFQFDRVMFGLECSVKVSPAKTETEVELNSVKKNVSARRRYSFGVSSRVGYNVCGGLIVYVKLGTDVTKFNLRSQKGDDKTTETKKNPRKMVMQASAGAEQSFGPWFVRGECGKSIGKGVGEIDGVNVTSGHWTGLVGAGYRF